MQKDKNKKHSLHLFKGAGTMAIEKRKLRVISEDMSKT